MTKAAPGSCETNRPASMSGCVTQAQKRPPGSSTRAASRTAPGMSWMSINEL